MTTTLDRVVRGRLGDEYEYSSDDAAGSVTIPLCGHRECLLSLSVWNEDSIGGSIGDGQADFVVSVYTTQNDRGSILETYEAVASQAVRIVGGWDKVKVEWSSADAAVHINAAPTGSVGLMGG